MSNRVVVGDVFAVPLGEGVLGFFQYIARDTSQLNSHVVRVFKERSDENAPVDVSQLTHGDVDFHAHVFLNVGLKKEVWRKVSHAAATGANDILFRDSSDYGRSKERVSDNWFVWRINGPFGAIGPLSGDACNAEIGVVVPPGSLVYRMNNGVYDFYYPEPGIDRGLP
jgi:hypothetical protein